MTVVLVTPHRFPDLEPETAVLAPLGVELVETASADELARRAGEAAGLLVTTTPVDASLIAELTACRAIVRYGIGVEVVDVEAATAAGIAVGNVVDASVEEVADHAVAMALALLRRLPPAAALVADGGWSLAPVAGAQRLRGLVAGIVGAGRIGVAVARRLEAFGMTAIGFDPYAQGGSIPLVELDELLARADLVSVHAPLTDATRGLLSAERLGRLRPSAVLVNVARGGIVDEAALATMLADGRLAGVGLDVFEREPLPADHPLRAQPRALLTPHVAWYSEQSLREVQHKAAEQIARAVRGEPLDPVVNPAVYG
jgi:D-3-phosphoglycerate dehydrogenase / 2-oxoglutarate reductase